MLAFAVPAMGVLATTTPALAEGPNAIQYLAGCQDNTLARNDDGSTGIVPIGFPVNFYGVFREALFVNNNGNVTFDGGSRPTRRSSSRPPRR